MRKTADRGLSFFDEVERPLASFVTENPDFQRLVAEQARLLANTCRAEKVKPEDIIATTPRFLLTGGAYFELRLPGSDPDRLENIEAKS